MSHRYPGGVISATTPTQLSGMWTLPQELQRAAANNWVKDPYFDYVTLLLKSVGANAAQNNTFLDSSSNAFTVTRNGGAPGMTQGTFSPFSQTGWSGYFSAGNYTAAPTSANLALGSGNFTLECWINTTVTANGRMCGNGTGGSFAANRWVILLSDNSNAGKMSVACYNYNSGGANMLASTVTVNDGLWHHFVISRSGNNWAMFIDGVRQGSTLSSAISLDGGSSEVIDIGWDNLSGEPTGFFGYISDFRVVKGTAVYDPTSATCTVPTSRLTAISGTSILTLQDNRFIDRSSNAFALTITGTPSIQPFSPFAPTIPYSAATVGGSGYFDGTSDYLSVGATAVPSGTSDYTIAAWIYLTANGKENTIICRSNTSGMLFWVDASNKLGLANFNVAGVIAGSTSLPINTWIHVAATRSGNTHNLYVNGVADAAPVTDSVSFQSAGSNYIGMIYNGSTGAFSGYISDLRILSVSSAITVPTAPLTAITNTQLLLNFTNAGIIDAASGNDIETVGNAQCSTGTVKYVESMYFDGTGDWLWFPASDRLSFGTGDFTVEAWVYWQGGGQYSKIVSSGTLALGCYFGIYSGVGSKLWFGNGANDVSFGSPSAITQNVWHHVACTRNGTSKKLFLDGAEIASATDSSVYSLSLGNTYVGNSGFDTGSNGYWLGYIEDLRITKYARYTTTFTPPTMPLQAQ